MSYMVPSERTCTVCGHKGKYSRDQHPRSPKLPSGDIPCPVCYEKFIKDNVGIMNRDKPLKTNTKEA